MVELVSEKDKTLKGCPQSESLSKITEWNGREIRHPSNPLFSDTLWENIQEVIEDSKKSLESPSGEEGKQFALKQIEDLSQFIGSSAGLPLLDPKKEETNPLPLLTKHSSSQDAILMIDPDASPRIHVNSPEILHAPPSIPRVFAVPGKKLARGQIGGINGVGNNFSTAQENAYYIAQLSDNHYLEWTFNRTNSILFDVLEATMFNFNGFSEPAKDLQANWIRFHKAHGNDQNAKYFQLCHSQGAIHVRNALQDAPQEIRDRVIVLAIAPAAIVPKWLCFDSYNYASKRDPTPYFEAAFKYDADATYEERISQPSREALKELILLEPHPDAPALDHFLDSPTFKQVIEQQIKNFIKEYGESQ